MNRAFRVPIFPALQGAARARFSTTPTAQNNNQANAPTPRAGAAGSTEVRPATFEKDPSRVTRDRMRQELKKVKGRLDTHITVKDAKTLLPVHTIMNIYRKYRDAEGHVEASEALHAILTMLRRRADALKPVISTVRKQIMTAQNEVLINYLNEITDDLVAGRSYASHFALTYLLTAFGTMEAYGQASNAWKRLNNSRTSEQPSIVADLVGKLHDPRVVSAALRTSDPSAITLEEFEKTYKDSTERNGRHLLADEALSIGYLRFKEFNSAVKMYTSMCEYYDVAKWENSLVRLHNNILTECTDIVIADVFFDAAIAEDSFVFLHPSAATAYVKHIYAATGDINKVVDVYEKAMKRLQTQSHDFGAANCLILSNECVNLVVGREFSLVGPTEEAKALIERIYKNQGQIVLNAVMSRVSETWEYPEYLAELKRAFPPLSELQFDAVRVLLNSSRALPIDIFSVKDVDELWQRLLSLKPPQLFDWQSLAKACNNADRVAYLVEKVASANLDEELRSKLGTRLDTVHIAKAALAEAGLLATPAAPDPSYSASVINSELNARSKPLSNKRANM